MPNRQKEFRFMPEEVERTWFPAKKYGWGWGVAHCWQGVLVQLSYPVLAVAGIWHYMPRHETGAFVVFLLVLTAIFLAIHWVKGERPSWRWGE